MKSYIFTILTILLGFILILLDILIIPGGFVGTAGGILILATIYYGYGQYGHAFAINISLFTALFSGILIWATIKYRLWSLLEHKETANKEEGFTAFTKDLALMVGKKGETITPLRPSGTVKIDGIKYDGVSEGELIDSRKEVSVTSVSKGQLVVRTTTQSKN